MKQNQNDWQPIETAPRDGTEILVSFVPKWRDSHVQTTASWNPRMNVVEDQNSDGSPKVDSNGDQEYIDQGGWSLVVCGAYAAYTDVEPTHWMPLPKGPE